MIYKNFRGRMFLIKKEFKKIWQNKLLFVTVIVVSLIPILYASVFLKSIWDPYGNMNELPVAVVNLDQSVDFQGKTLSVGSELVDNLKKNDDLGWHFVSKDAAKQGLKDRKYYMVVTIPKDFSKNAATVLDSDPEKMNLKYETNAGVNYLGEVVSDNAMKQLKAQVSEKVTKSYAMAIISTINELGKGMNTAAEGSEKLNDGANQVNTGVGTLAKSVPTLADGVSQLDNGAGSLKSGVSQYTAGVAQVADGSNQLNNGVGQLTSQLPTLTNGLSALGTGANSLSAGLIQYTGGVAQVANGSTQLNNGVGQLASQLPTLTNGLGALGTGANDLSTGLAQYTGGVNKIAEGNKALNSQMPELVRSVSALNNGANQISSGLNSVDISALSNLGQLAGALQTVASHLETAGNSLANTSNSMASDVQSNTVAVVTALNKAGITDPNLANVVGQSLATNAQNTKVAADIQNAGNELTAVKQILQGVESQMPNLDPNIVNKFEKLQQGATALSNGLNELNTKMPTLSQSVDELAKGSAQLAAKSSELTSGANQLASGLKEVNAKTPTLTNGVSQLADGLSQVATGANTLNNNSAQLTSGANQLANGLNTVNEKTPALASGVNQLANGVSTLANGANTLNSKSGELNDGTAKLADGLDTLNGKIPSLSSGVLKLKDGTGQLADGTNELATKLKDGSAKINDLSLGDKNAEMIANPAKETQTKYSSVPNYGHALAPYFMSVSLFVGSLVFNFVYPIRKIANRKGASAAQWFRSKVTIGGLVATTMALVIGTVMQMIGLTVSNQWQFYGILLATAWVNMFLIMFLAMSFDNPGRFIAVLLLVVQLGSAGGVFPMEITSRFYNIVHPYIPMTYSIYGLRQSISTGLGNELYNQSLLILVVLIIALLALLRLSMQILFKRGLAGYSQLHNTQKLLDDDYMNKREKYTLW
ncbi:YhgE/Pip domain protein [Enterococcus italicus DSM 15952]|uniref:YhgE/Pip domain protein n=2 Tax=Enterococcus italicus TaxID=246144 RepID=E6LHQ7_ENTI1|nr:YhgE/Pip domain protein [Enterococcus italicus DSM 15952]